MLSLSRGISFILESVCSLVSAAQLDGPDLLLSLEVFRIVQLSLRIPILFNGVWNLEFSAQIINVLLLAKNLLNFRRLLILSTLQGSTKLLSHLHNNPLQISYLSIFLLSQEPEVIPLSLQPLAAPSHFLSGSLQLLLALNDLKMELTVLLHDLLILLHQRQLL